MIEKLKKIANKRWFHFVVMAFIVVSLLFILGITILDYNENGETNMPFNITKLSVISTSEGIDKESNEFKWSFDLSQINDIYLYIDKNPNYDKTDSIKNVLLNNFNVSKENETGEIKIFKPDAQNANQIFTNNEENVENSIQFSGETASNLKNLKISNQGGIVAFRCSNTKLATYNSNEEDEINHSELLKKAGLTKESLSMHLSFDITIELDSGKSYIGRVHLDLPIEDVVEQTITNVEITDLQDVVFKRINN